jgi:hypothetical protein
MELSGKYWIARTGIHSTDMMRWKPLDDWNYELSPDCQIGIGDVLYLWNNTEQELYGWAIVVKAPHIGKGNNQYIKGDRCIVPVKRSIEDGTKLGRLEIETIAGLRELLTQLQTDQVALPISSRQAQEIDRMIKHQGNKVLADHLTDVRFLAQLTR